MDVEQKLAEYRAKKRRQAYLNTANKTLKSVFSLGRKKTQMSTSSETETGYNEDKALIINDNEILIPVTESEGQENCGCSYLTVISYGLYFVLWLTLLIIFIKLQFGLVFLVVSALAAIYLNTRTGPKKKDEVSAYSVFNPNCESIDGTLKAEQFEREIRYGPNAIH